MNATIAIHYKMPSHPLVKFFVLKKEMIIHTPQLTRAFHADAASIKPPKARGKHTFFRDSTFDIIHTDRRE